MRGWSRHAPGLHLAGKGAIGAEQKLLARLASGVKRARDLGAAEGAGREIAGIVAGKGHALGHALVDDVGAELRQPVHVRLAGAEVAALDGVDGRAARCCRRRSGSSWPR